MVFLNGMYHEIAGITVMLFGGKDGDPTIYAETYARKRTTQIDYTILPPSDKHGQGFQQVITDPADATIHADGLLLEPKQTATIRSKDCPIVCIKNQTTGRGVLVHAGRAAMTPDENGWNIIRYALFAVVHSPSDTLFAFIRAGICGRCFVHHPVTDYELIQPFLGKYSSAVNHNTYGIDLVAIIKMQLRQAGIPPERIDHDELCTLEEPGLSSHRGKDAVSNLVLVLNH
jgi:copper oxidase (laccase) domain-containing protein